METPICEVRLLPNALSTLSVSREVQVSAMDGGSGVWQWDDNERGIVLHGQDLAGLETLRGASRLTIGRGVVPGCRLELKFVDAVDNLDLMRFKRHWQRRSKPGQRDIVILRDIKDVVLFQAQQALPADLLQWFHTVAVDRFLQTLMLYCSFYIQAWEDVSYRASLSANKIVEPHLSARQQRQQSCLATLRVLVARDYHTLLLGDGRDKFHHMANGVQSWSQRDARLWELLLALSVRVVWVALRRRYLNVIEAEVGRLFRGQPFNRAARRQDAANAKPGLREDILHGRAEHRYRRLFTRSPATLELLGVNRPHWTLLALGRLPMPYQSESMQRLEAAYAGPGAGGAEDSDRGPDSPVGILGMMRSDVDVMLNVNQRQQRPHAIPATVSDSEHLDVGDEPDVSLSISPKCTLSASTILSVEQVSDSLQSREE